MSFLSDQEIQTIQSANVSYEMLGINSMMHNPIFVPDFQSSDDASSTIEGLSIGQILGNGEAVSALGSIKLSFDKDKISVGVGNRLIELDGQNSQIRVGGTSITLDGLKQLISVGGTNFIIDGANKRLLINDGTNDRVLAGFQSGGF